MGDGGRPFASTEVPRHLLRSLLAVALVCGPALPAPAQEAPASQPPATFFRSIQAARRTGQVSIDGRADELAWNAAELGDGFTQFEPDEGAPPTAPTRFRVLWDDDSIYVAIECDDPVGPTATLSRRDRAVEGDWVSFDLDTTNDRRTAYHFQVFAGGQQLDALHFNDTEFTTDWDAAWESAVLRTESGWSAEVRIPLRILRVPDGASEFGFNVYRYLARRKEQDQWRYRPRGSAGDVSLLGRLTGVRGIRPVRSLELRPYLASRSTMTTPAPGPAIAPFRFAPCSSVGIGANGVAAGCAGLDLRYSLASDLSLVATVNPDFGQVEADQRVLNLSTFETFFPEKRPFFTEGLDLFQSPLRISFGGAEATRTRPSIRAGSASRRRSGTPRTAPCCTSPTRSRSAPRPRSAAPSARRRWACSPRTSRAWRRRCFARARSPTCAPPRRRRAKCCGSASPSPIGPSSAWWRPRAIPSSPPRRPTSPAGTRTSAEPISPPSMRAATGASRDRRWDRCSAGATRTSRTTERSWAAGPAAWR